MIREEELLKRTLTLARTALQKGNYPIGALVANKEGEIVTESFNVSFSENNPVGHAEISCMKNMGKELMDKAKNFALYSSLEPCLGCSFFLRYTSINKIVWALTDPYKGGITELREIEKTKDEFSKLEIIDEPSNELKELSRRMMYDFLISKGKNEAALHYKKI